MLAGAVVLLLEYCLVLLFPQLSKDFKLAYFVAVEVSLGFYVKFSSFDPIELQDIEDKIILTKYTEPFYYDHVFNPSKSRKYFLSALNGTAFILLIFLAYKTLKVFTMLTYGIPFTAYVYYFYSYNMNSESLKLTKEGIYISSYGFLPWSVITTVNIKELSSGWNMEIETLEGHYSSTYLYFLIRVKTLKKILDSYNVKYIVQKKN